MDQIASILRTYGADLLPDGRIVSPAGRTLTATVVLHRGRMVVASTCSRLYSGTPESIGAFVESFWFWRKLAAPGVAVAS